MAPPYTGPQLLRKKLMSVSAPCGPWGLAWHVRIPSSQPKPTTRLLRAILRGTLGGNDQACSSSTSLQPVHQRLLATEARPRPCKRSALVLVLPHVLNRPSHHPTLVHNCCEKLMSVNAQSGTWGLAWHMRIPSIQPKPATRLLRAILRGTLGAMVKPAALPHPSSQYTSGC